MAGDQLRPPAFWAVAGCLVQGNVRMTHRNVLRAGSRGYPNDTAAAVLTMIRIGLDGWTARYPAMPPPWANRS